MDILRCDICGGRLMIQAGGKIAVCDSCGMQYSVERVREKVQEIRGTVRVEGAVQARQTGTDDDVAQWRMLVRKYYDTGDFQAANQIVKKILEAVPTDTEANHMYDELQVLKFMEVRNGVLVKYSGQMETLTIPACVEKIGDQAFSKCSTLKDIYIPEGVIQIGICAFERCTDLRSIHIPTSVTYIGNFAFSDCEKLENVTIPEHLIRAEVFGYYDGDDEYRCNCSWYKKYQVDMWERQQAEERRKQAELWKSEGRCQYCGFNFSSGLLGPVKCKKCGRPKDY